MTIIVKPINGVCRVDPYGGSDDVPVIRAPVGGYMTWDVCNKCSGPVDVQLRNDPTATYRLDQLFVSFNPDLFFPSTVNNIPVTNLSSDQRQWFSGTTTSDPAYAGRNKYQIAVKLSSEEIGAYRVKDPQLQLDEGLLLTRLRVLLALLAAGLIAAIAFLIGRRVGLGRSASR
jgi:hypothetical protein